MRLGAIYALERIAKESEPDYWAILAILTAYVQERVPLRRNQDHTPPSEIPPILAADIQAILTVIGRRMRSFGKGENVILELAFTDLAGANLGGANLEKVGLLNTSLQWAYFGEARLAGAILVGAYLEKANLSHARLRGAMLSGAHLSGADHTGARLEGVFLNSADLRGVRGLTLEQLARVGTLYEAQLDPPLFEQIKQQYPHLLEEFQIKTTSS
jgi:hypothetical protein